MMVVPVCISVVDGLKEGVGFVNCILHGGIV